MRFVSGSRQNRQERFERPFGTPDDAQPSTPRETSAELPRRVPAIVPLSEPALVPDLLNPIATLTVDAAVLRRALSFSFIAEDDGGVLACALDDAPLASSSFDPECFFHDLFIDDFVRTCMAVRIGGRPVSINHKYLVRVLSQPPADPDVAALRTKVWRQLADSADARSAVERVYLALWELRRLFEGQGRVGIRGEQARRRIDILEQLKRTLDEMASPALRESDSSLARIADFAAHVKESAGYQKLHELLQYDNQRAFVQLTLQLGADGGVRGLSVVHLRENASSPYHVSALRRWLGRTWLWLKGYRVSDDEVLDRWLDQVFEGVVAFVPPLMQLMGDIELYLSGLAFRASVEAAGLSVCFPELVEHADESEVEGLFNPLLLGLGVAPVPASLSLGRGGEIALITGPNSGGKTRLLQALGILHLCAQGGMFVPAQRARLVRTPGIFASLVQAASAEQPEGRLGTELLRIRMLFERAAPGCLVLVDELCSGTSPSEGEEMFQMVLELLHELAPHAFVSTHFLKFAAALQREGGGLSLRFLQVELDDAQRPTYRFVEGVAETSLARQTASRLGVTREELRALLAAKRR